MFIFLKANQQDDEALSEFFHDVEDPDAVEPESNPSHNVRVRYQKSMEGEDLDWETLKNRKLVLPSGQYSNPYVRRIDVGSVVRTPPAFIREYRETGELSFFDPDCITKYR